MTSFPHIAACSLRLPLLLEQNHKAKEVEHYMKDGGQQRWATNNLRTPTVLMFVLVVVAVTGLRAQTSTTGGIAGVVTDPTTAVVSGVSVTLTNVDSGSSSSTTTNSQGSYNFPLLQPGNYSVSARAAGFQTIVMTVTVALGAHVTPNFELSISSHTKP